MAENKYGEYIINGPFSVDNVGGVKGIQALHNEYGAGVSLTYLCINGTDYAQAGDQKNDFNRILCFVGGNPEDIHNFGAEIKVYLGPEKEEHVITGPAVVSIPAGLVYGPVKVIKCDKPVVMLEIDNTGIK